MVQESAGDKKTKLVKIITVFVKNTSPQKDHLPLKWWKFTFKVFLFLGYEQNVFWNYDVSEILLVPCRRKDGINANYMRDESECVWCKE